MSGQQKYRKKYEVSENQEKDSITNVKNVLLDNKWMTEEEIKAVEKEVKAEVEEAVKFAEESPLPEPHELYEDVYTQEDYPFVKD